MATDTKISSLTALTGANTASGDLLLIVDVSDTTQASTGTTKRITRDELKTALGVALPITSITFGMTSPVDGNYLGIAGIGAAYAVSFSCQSAYTQARLSGGCDEAALKFDWTNAAFAIGEGPSIKFVYDGSNNVKLELYNSATLLATTNIASISGDPQTFAVAVLELR